MPVKKSKKKEDKKTKVRKAMFKHMEDDGKLYPKSKSGKRTKPRKTKAKSKSKTKKKK